MRALSFYCRILILVLSLALTASEASEFREFTSMDGRKMNAKLVNPIGSDEVRIVRTDGYEFNAMIESFSSADQKFIKDWIQSYLLKQGKLFDVKTAEARTSKNKTGGRHYDLDMWEGYYKVTVKNISSMELGNLDVQYRMYLYDDYVSEWRSSDGTLKSKSGKFKIGTLPPTQEARFETTKVEMKETKIDNGGRGRFESKSKDDLEGIWVRIYKEGKLLYEFSNPSSIMKNREWK